MWKQAEGEMEVVITVEGGSTMFILVWFDTHV